MIRYVASLVALCIGLAACGKKPEAAAPVEKVAPAKVSVDATPADAPPPPIPAPEALPPDSAAPGGSSEPVSQDEIAAVGPARVAQIEAALHEFQAGDAAVRANVVKKLRAAKLNAAERALLEITRKRYGYDPLQLN